jgi:hypothetical protein
MSYLRNVRAAAPVNGVVEVGVGFGTEPGNAEKLAGYADSLCEKSGLASFSRPRGQPARSAR